MRTMTDSLPMDAARPVESAAGYGRLTHRIAGWMTALPHGPARSERQQYPADPDWTTSLVNARDAGYIDPDTLWRLM